MPKKKKSEPELMYAVLRLSTYINVSHKSTGKVHSLQIEGIDGFIPVYKTPESAFEASENGKYQVIPIKEIQH